MSSFAGGDEGTIDQDRQPAVACRFSGKDRHVVLDQLRTVDRERLVQRLGVLTAPTQAKVLGVLQAMFAP